MIYIIPPKLRNYSMTPQSNVTPPPNETALCEETISCMLLVKMLLKTVLKSGCKIISARSVPYNFINFYLKNHPSGLFH